MDPFIFVHGHANDTHGNLSVFTQQRIDCADDLQQHQPNTIMIASGGTGHFNQTSTPHAHYIRDCWLEMGIARNRIVTFDTPQHTVDEIQCLKSWCLAHGSTSGWIISSDFHIDRIDFICQRLLKGLSISLIRVDSKSADPALRQRAITHEQKRLDQLKQQGGVLIDNKLFKPQ